MGALYQKQNHVHFSTKTNRKKRKALGIKLNNTSKNRLANEPLIVQGVTTEGKKIYSGDKYLRFPNRKDRRYYEKQQSLKTKNNSKLTKGTQHKIVYRYIKIGNRLLKQVKGIVSPFLSKK